MQEIPSIIWKKRTGLGVFFLLLLAALAIAILLLNSPWGIGVGYDSKYYLDAAEGVLRGAGLVKVGSGGQTKPLDHFPPLYPLSLALLGRIFGISALEAARWLGAILFGLNIGLIGLLISRCTRSWLASIVGALAAFLSPIILNVHLDAMTEPLFIFFLLLFLWWMMTFFERRSYRWLIASGLAAGLAFLTRYIGGSVLATGAIALLLWGNGRRSQRARLALLFASIGFLPMIPWIVRNLALSGSATDRIIAWHPISRAMIRKGAVSVSSWILPVSAPTMFRLLAIFGAAIVFLFLAVDMILRRPKNGGHSWQVEDIFPALAGIFSFVYLVSLAISMTFFDAATPLTNRILAPVYTTIFLASLSLAVGFLRSVNRGVLFGTISVAMVLGLLGCYASQSMDLWKTLRLEGRRLTSRAWRESETMELLRRMDPGVVIFTNEPQPVSLHTGIPAFRAPERWDSIKGRVPENYEESLASMRRALEAPNSALVIFHPENLRKETTPLEILTQGLALLRSTKDGAIYVFPDNLDRWSDLE